MLTKNTNPSWLDRNIFPFASRFVEIAGNTVHYVDEGQGPVLLLLHGNASYSFTYREIITALAPYFRCIALDLPGFGLSSAKSGYTFTPKEHSAVVEQFVGALHLDGIRLMVHDWGGPIGLGFAGRRPDLFHSVIIGNTWAWPAEKGSALAKFAKLAGSPIGTFLIERVNFLIRMMNPIAASRKFTEGEKAAYRGPFPDAEARRPMAIFPKEILRSRKYLEEVESGLVHLRSKPVLLVWGDKDTGFAEPERERFERAFPSSTTQILAGAKHFIQEDAPKQIASGILSFERM